MVETTGYSLINIKNELLNRLRSHFIDKDPLSRVEQKTISFTGDGVKSIFKISNNLSCINNVVLDGIDLHFGVDYEIIWRGDNKGSIILPNIPADGLSLEVNYGDKKENGNFIYPDFPRSDIGEGNIPRIGFKLNGGISRVGGSGVKSVAYNHDMILQIKVIDRDTFIIDDLVVKLYDFFGKYFKTFYYVPYIDPQNINDYDDFNDNTEKNHAKIIEFRIPYKYDIKQVI